MVNFGPLAAEIVSLVWGTPGNFLDKDLTFEMSYYYFSNQPPQPTSLQLPPQHELSSNNNSFMPLLLGNPVVASAVCSES